ncbi:MAG: hypothetical protein U0L92_03795 [Clostridia bacterium]|nr:hypothetical protein [Clostridia bacterium]
MKLMKMIAMTMAFSLAATMLVGCGKKDESAKISGDDTSMTASSKGSNVVQKSEPQEGDDSQKKNFEVQLDERTEETQYLFGLEDLSFVDTVTGKKVTIGMTEEELGNVAGTPIASDQNYRIYDGLIVQLDEGNKVVSLLVSGGLFLDANQGTRFMSCRGVGLHTSFEDFTKAYGDLSNEKKTQTAEDGSVLNETAGIAIRYFVVDGEKVEYLGTQLTNDQKEKYAGKIYMQDFMFDKETNEVVTMRVINLDYLGK